MRISLKQIVLKFKNYVKLTEILVPIQTGVTSNHECVKYSILHSNKT